MRKRFGLHWWTSLVLAGLVLFLPGCERKKKINQILLDPHRFADREVEVTGKVVRSFSVLGHGAYEVDDGTGTLWVISKTGVPREGAPIQVKGTIRDAVNLGELGPILRLPESVRSGVVMIESRRKVKD